MENSNITYFAKTDYRNRQIPFGIKAEDRTRHMYVIGKTGMGKSTLLENLAIQDIQNGNGLAFIDPHGKSAELLLDYVPENRIKDVLYFAPFDMEYPIAFNVMEDIGPDKRHLVVNGLMSTFEKIWVDAWSARMAYILNNTLLALLEYPESTLLGINRVLADKEYRKEVIAHIEDPSVKSFWVDEFAKYTDRYAQEATPAIQNKVGQFTSNPLIRNIIGQQKSSFNLREMMDKKKILIVNLSKGRVGEGNANLLGSMLVTKIYLAAMSRADATSAELHRLPSFNLYVDEFQSFANKSFSDILSEARKYKLNLTIAHQYIEQMEEEVRAAVFGNVGTLVTFRVGATDAEYLEKEFAPVFLAEDLVNLGIYQIYLKLMIDGVSSAPFSATTIPPIRLPSLSWKDEIIKSSRDQFANPRATVEEHIIKWHQPLNQGSQAKGEHKELEKKNYHGSNQSFFNHQKSAGISGHFEGNENKEHREKHQPFARAFSDAGLKVDDDHNNTENTKLENDNQNQNNGQNNDQDQRIASFDNRDDKKDHSHSEKKNNTNNQHQHKLKNAHDGKEGTLRDLLNNIIDKQKESGNQDKKQYDHKEEDNSGVQKNKREEIDPSVLKEFLANGEEKQN